MRKNFICTIVLILLIVSETLLVLVFPEMKLTTQPLNSMLHFIFSLLFGIVLLIKFYNKPQLFVYEKLSGKSKILVYFLIVVSFFLLNSVTIKIIKTFDFKHYSDIIPAVQILVKRLLSGQNPYDPNAMEPLLYHGPSNYLSMHWLPYTIAEFFHFDYRTIAFAIWYSGALVIMIRSIRSQNIWSTLFVIIATTVAYMLIVIQVNFIIGATVEIMVVGYYMLFIAGLNQKNNILAGFVIAICLLSRYYIVLWMPLWFFVLVLSGNKKQLLKITLSIFFFVLILYIIPFLSKDWSILYSSFKNYENLPYHEWLNAGVNQLPGHLYNGTGLAWFFYEQYCKTDPFIGYLLLKKIFYIAIFLTVFIMGFWYWFKRPKINYKIFLLASFKIYLSVFLAFIPIPYLYLMITGIFVSIAIFAEQSHYKLAQKN